MADGARRWRGAHAAGPNRFTGMPIALALSAKFSLMPLPGKTMTPIGKVSSSLSLRLNGAALAWRAQSGLNPSQYQRLLSPNLSPFPQLK